METKLIIIYFVFVFIMLNGVYANEHFGIMPIDPDPSPIIVTPEIELEYEVIIINFTKPKSGILEDITLTEVEGNGIILSDVDFIKEPRKLPSSNSTFGVEKRNVKNIDFTNYSNLKDFYSEKNIVPTNGGSLKNFHSEKYIDSMQIKIIHGVDSIPLELFWISENVRSDLNGNMIFEKILSSGKIVSIERTKNDIKLESDGITAYTKEELIIEKSGIYIEKDNEKFEISILPYAAFEKINDNVDIVNNIELKAEDDHIFYDIEGIKKSSLFGVVPIDIDIRVRVNAESGELYNLEEPWWNIFVF